MSINIPRTACCFVVAWFLAAAAIGKEAEHKDPYHFDLLLRGGEIVDGSGAARYRADIGINGDEIVAIGRLAQATAKRVIDVHDRIVAPGFIDLHAHVADGEFGKNGLLSRDPRRRAAQNFVAQGITTAVANPDGFQSMPLREQRRALEEDGIGLNVILMNGHSAMRHEAMQADVNRAATQAEIRQMQAVLRQGLVDEGSFGMSLGLEYDPARYASTEEQLELARVLALHNGIFLAHVRSHGFAPLWYRPSQHKGVKPPTLDDSIDETVHIAESSAITAVITHVKAWGPGYRGEASRLIAKFEAARARGVRIFMDVYPYDSSMSDGTFVAMPPWIFGASAPQYSARESAFDYRAAFEKQWAAADEQRRNDFALDVRHALTLKGGASNVRVLAFPRAEYVDKSYADLMQLRDLDEVALAIALQLEGDPRYPGGARMRSFSMDERDIEAFYQLDWCAMSTDGWIVLPEKATGARKYENTNRRVFGSYPRRIAHYTLERKVDTLEHAVWSASGLPARILNLRDRGQLAAGMRADVVVLDLKRLRDNTTHFEPSAYPSGVDHVLVNGRLVVDSGQRTLALPGRVLRPVRGPASQSPSGKSGQYRE